MPVTGAINPTRRMIRQDPLEEVRPRTWVSRG